MIIYLMSYFGLIIGVRSIILFKQTRINASKGFGKQSKTKRAERIIQAALFLMIIIGLNYTFFEPNYKYFFPIKFLELGWLKTIGFTIGICGILITFIAQLQMKNSWRLGIDEQEKLELITSGLFSITRNPIYLSLGISFIGFFLIAPNIGSIIFLILMFYGIAQKVNDEQEFLAGKFGEEYEKYRSNVNKWI